MGISEGSQPHALPYALEAPKPQRAPPYVLEAKKPQRVPQHFEVASDFDKNQPQLMKIRKIESVHVHNRVSKMACSSPFYK